MKRKSVFKIRNIATIFIEDNEVVLAEEGCTPVDAKYLDVIFENVCPDCPDNEKIESYNIGVCKVLSSKVVKYSDIKNEDMSNDMLNTVLIDLKLKNTKISDESDVVLYTVKNQLIK